MRELARVTTVLARAVTTALAALAFGGARKREYDHQVRRVCLYPCHM